MALQNSQPESGGGPGCGCLAVIVVVIALGVAGYYALVQNADFPGAVTIRTFADEAKETYEQARRQDVPSAVIGFQDTASEQKQSSDPTKRHLELKKLMLNFTNEQRQATGVPPVKLGSNPAAQLHAEASLAGCYSSHWDEWGLNRINDTHLRAAQVPMVRMAAVPTTASHHGRTTPR